MGRQLLVAALVIIAISGSASADTAAQRGRKWIVAVIQAVGGGPEALRARKGVEYEYWYRLPNGKADVSIERYMFDGELSWAKYTKHEAVLLPGVGGEVVQGFDGKTSWMTVNGKRVAAPKLLKRADFSRKTNFYWFAMMHKLADPGTRHQHVGQRKVGGITYELVELTFGAGIGDAQDRYVLYVNPKTKLVDQFLFTVMDFGRVKPLLMVVKYANVDGLQLPVTRKYTPSDWTGRVTKNAKWTDEIMREVRFRKDLSRAAFAAPTSS